MFKKSSYIIILLSFFFVAPSFGDSITYHYDPLNRLIRADYSNGTMIVYTYDAAGNILLIDTQLALTNRAGDGTPNEDQIQLYGTDPDLPNTDGDGVLDGTELAD